MAAPTPGNYPVEEKFFNTIQALSMVENRFKKYSYNDGLALIETKMESFSEPAALYELYNLEALIADLRQTLARLKDERVAARIAGTA
jgi:hypothetical protein